VFTTFFGGEFYAGEFFNSAPTPVIIIDTHDGGRRERGWKKRVEARERLRDQIRFALDGPAAAEVLAIVGNGPVDIATLADADRKRIAAAYQAYLDDEDDVEMLLLS
jgi:hypothetical protein